MFGPWLNRPARKTRAIKKGEAPWELVYLEFAPVSCTHVQAMRVPGFAVVPVCDI